MPRVHMSLLRESVGSNRTVDANGLFGALWPLEGRVAVSAASPAQDGAWLLQGRGQVSCIDDTASWLRFALSEAPLEAPGLLHSDEIEIDTDLALLRLDTVMFPPGAVAYRHVHPGPGIRHLLQGELDLQSDHHSTVVTAGDSWFEPADTPVRATASPEHAKTGFVRFMVLPPEFLGKPSIRILDQTDAARPRLQITHRHLDQVVRLPQGR